MKSFVAFAFVLSLSTPVYAWQDSGYTGASDLVHGALTQPTTTHAATDGKVEDSTPAQDTNKPYIRQDQIVVDTTKGPPKLPANMLVLRQLVDSKTTVDGYYLYQHQRGFFKSSPKLVANKKIEYEYSVNVAAMNAAAVQDYAKRGIIQTTDNVHYFLWTNTKIENVRDVRNWVIAHPKQARFQGYAKRVYDRTAWMVTPLAVLLNAIIIKG